MLMAKGVVATGAAMASVSNHGILIDWQARVGD
jgi:hypothetical protein